MDFFKKTYLFSMAYIKSMRLYYSFVTGLVGWIGVSYYEYLCANSLDSACVAPSRTRQAAILVLLFLAWGINQIFNDYLGLAEDRINAPHRPMVTGALPVKVALVVSSVLVLASASFVALALCPIALIPFFLGVALNFVYEWAKGYGVLGNIVFGLMVTNGTVFGLVASGPITAASFSATFVCVLILVFVLNAVLTFYTYFKDHDGDAAAGKRTLVVQLGVERARRLAVWLAFVPTVVFLILWLSGALAQPLSPLFGLLAGTTAFLQIWNGVQFYRRPAGRDAYTSLSLNFRAYCCAFATLVGLFFPVQALVLFLVAYIAIEFLFQLHRDEKA